MIAPGQSVIFEGINNNNNALSCWEIEMYSIATYKLGNHIPSTISGFLQPHKNVWEGG